MPFLPSISSVLRAALHSRWHFNLTEDLSNMLFSYRLIAGKEKRVSKMRSKIPSNPLPEHIPSIYSAFYCTRHFGKNCTLSARGTELSANRDGRPGPEALLPDISASSVLDAEDAAKCRGTIAERRCHWPHLREVE